MTKWKTDCSFLLGAGLILLIGIGTMNCSGDSSTDSGQTGTGQSTVSPTQIQPADPVACENTAPEPTGRTYYLDPVNGTNTNDGSAQNPWGTLQALVEAGMIETRSYANLPYNGANPLNIKNPGALVGAGDTLVSIWME